jgi:hypothetical protein
MMIASMLIFASVAFCLSFFIGRSKDLDRGRIAVYVTLVAWGSMLYGLCMAKIIQ